MKIQNVTLYVAMELEIYDPSHAPRLIYHLACFERIAVSVVIDTAAVMKLSKGHQSPAIGCIAVVTLRELGGKNSTLLTSDPIEFANILSKCSRQI